MRTYLTLIATICCCISVCTSCSSSSPTNTQNFGGTTKTVVTLQELANAPITHEPRLEGIPLSCRLKYAQTISDNFGQAYELSDIARTYAEFGFYDQALSIHGFLINRSSGNSITGDLIALFAEREQFDQAIQLVEEEITSSAKADWLTIVAQEAAQANRVDIALELANSIQDPVGVYKAKILAEIAANYAKSGQQDKADRFFEQSLKLVDSKAGALFNIAESFANARDYEKALELLNTAREQSRGKEVDIAVTETSLRIARIAIDDKQFESANKALSQALKVASPPSAFRTDSSWLTEIAVRYAEMGQLDQALDVAQSIDEDSRRLEALLIVAKQYWKIGQLDQANRIFSLARELAETPKNYPRVNVESNVFKSKNLVQLSDTYRETGQVEIANRILNEAFQTAKAIKELDDQTREIGSIAKKYAEIKNYDQALIAAETIRETKERKNLTELIRCTSQ